ncbi:MAG: hypothetical protein WC569_00285 [Candidatus Omnitrophota bacterium]
MDDIRPLKGPVEISDWFLMWVFIIFILFIAAVTAFFYFRKKMAKKNEPVLPPRPPEEIAMEELAALLEEKLAEKGMVKEYYIRLSDIIRKFIEGRFRVSALDRTTWELYQEMRSKRFERGHIDKINDFLEDCDMVKFAKYIPARAETEEIYRRAEEIVAIR